MGLLAQNEVSYSEAYIEGERMSRRDVKWFDLLNQLLCDPLNGTKFVITVKTSLISREQRDVARPHSCQEGLLAIVQPLNGTGLSAMTHSLFCGTDYLRSGIRINGSMTPGSLSHIKRSGYSSEESESKTGNREAGDDKHWSTRLEGGRSKRSVDDTIQIRVVKLAGQQRVLP